MKNVFLPMHVLTSLWLSKLTPSECSSVVEPMLSAARVLPLKVLKFCSHLNGLGALGSMRQDSRLFPAIAEGILSS